MLIQRERTNPFKGLFSRNATPPVLPQREDEVVVDRNSVGARAVDAVVLAGGSLVALQAESRAMRGIVNVKSNDGCRFVDDDIQEGSFEDMLIDEMSHR